MVSLAKLITLAQLSAIASSLGNRASLLGWVHTHATVICSSEWVLVMSESTPISAINTPAALLNAYTSGQRSFSGLSLGPADLKGVDLKGADLSYADLSNADLSQANLRGTDLSYASLREANLTEADLRGAMLIGTNLRQANITATNFHEADYDPTETQFPEGFDPVDAAMRSDRA